MRREPLTAALTNSNKSTMINKICLSDCKVERLFGNKMKLWDKYAITLIVKRLMI